MDDNKPIRVIGWANWNNDKFPRYEYPYESGEYERVKGIVAAALRESKYHWDGGVHQSADFGVPVLDNGCKETYSWRGWGSVMAMAYPDEIDNADDCGYCEWAFCTRPENKKLEKYPPESEWL